MTQYIPIIGLEIHVELKTKSKMFCQCSADYFHMKPNSNTCPVCLGLPGALPVPNKTAIEWTMKIGKALNCKLNTHFKFDRKHYFYPDLPKGYQISQLDKPICGEGHVEVFFPAKNKEAPQSHVKKFRIERVHLEEDTGKLSHKNSTSLIDFNRSGVPLVEIVTGPDFESAEEVKAFLEELYTIITYLDVSDANLDEGSMRMEPNISLTLKRGVFPDYKVEVKNINSFNFAKKAIEFEIRRQTAILEKGKTPKQETRGYNEDKGITFAQRSKEEAKDYRYFSDPDIPPFVYTKGQIDKITRDIPELPLARLTRFISSYGLRDSDAFQLTRTVNTAEYFESVLNECAKEKRKELAQKIAHAIINKRISTKLSPKEFAEKLLESLTPKETDITLLKDTIDRVLARNAKAVSDYKKGKTSVIMFLVGQAMREMKGKADASMVRIELEKSFKNN
ncbi:Asp-tRNA(Asn)/Glu-tRNA(Gln) amidotransferase subunit GatB [Candidatus Woesebacteria bacterium]|nr:Asp-tRNA(Asn)/Glu-tRNA(Gln) amidotransferase subunit GatB [Candidatus Woesebacteria bacterium]